MLLATLALQFRRYPGALLFLFDMDRLLLAPNSHSNNSPEFKRQFITWNLPGRFIGIDSFHSGLRLY